MCSRILLVTFFVVALTINVWARPPKSIEVIYNFEKKILHLDIKHISEDPQEHFIRRIVITQGDKEIEKIFLTKQTTAAGAKIDIPLELDPGDHVRIKAFCNEGGSEEINFTVPSLEVSEP